jgi:hypothetical protein
MKVPADGRTPLPRSLIADEVETDDGYSFELVKMGPDSE